MIDLLGAFLGALAFAVIAHRCIFNPLHPDRLFFVLMPQQVKHNAPHIAAMPKYIPFNGDQRLFPRQKIKQAARFRVIAHLDVAIARQHVADQVGRHPAQHQAGVGQGAHVGIVDVAEDAGEELPLHQALLQTELQRHGVCHVISGPPP